MKEIVVVAPIASLAEAAREVVERNSYDNVEVLLVGNLQEGLEAAQKAVDEGAKIVVSRGGTYDLIKAEMTIPVVDIKVTAFDLIESFTKAKQQGAVNPVGVIGHRNVIAGADAVAHVMGLKTVSFEVTSKSDIAAEVERQIALGVKVFVGNARVESEANRRNCTAIMVHSGNQAIHQAIQEAEQILQAAWLQKEKAQQFATIIDFVHDGIVAIDNLGFITVFNSASERITGVSKQEALGRNIVDIIPDTRLLNVLQTQNPEIGDIQRLDNETVIATNRVPVIVEGKVRGAVATYQDISEVQRLEQKIRIQLSEKGFAAKYTFFDIVYRSAEMDDCIRTAQKFSATEASVLISGPSGVGKELFAQSIHNHSKRMNSPFVAINCAALPEALIESELFGYVEGSFTGATKKGKAGLFEMAHGGTIFLDEISELPMVLQGRLLRVLQEKQVMRIGDNKLIPVDVRVICSSNLDLRNLVKQNKFRVDLYFRIAILSLYIPALNDRLEDLDVLCLHFVNVLSQRYRKGRLALGPEAFAYLQDYVFEGNVRELYGMIERAVVVCESKVIGVSDLTSMPYGRGHEKSEVGLSLIVEGGTLKEVEQSYIDYVFQKANGSIKEASAILGIDRTTLWRHITKRQISLSPRS